MKCYLGFLALASGVCGGLAQDDSDGPETQLADLLMNAANGDLRGIEGMDAQYGYLGTAEGQNSFDPILQFNVTKLVQLFGERMAEAQNGLVHTKTQEEFNPLQQAEHYGADKSSRDYFCPICEDNTFYPYGRCKVAEKRYVANAVSCEAYCESLVYNQIVTFMSFGGTRGKYAGVCICYRYKPYTRPIRCPDIGAASYPITVKNYFIDNGVCNFQFHAEDPNQCRKGCLLNAWFNGRPNAVYSYEGRKDCKGKDDDCSMDKGGCDAYYGGCPPTPSWRPPRLEINCKCFWQVFKWSTCRRFGAQIGTGAACQYLITGEVCYRCRKDNWRGDDCKNCKDYPRKD